MPAFKFYRRKCALYKAKESEFIEEFIGEVLCVRVGAHCLFEVFAVELLDNGFVY